MKFWTKFELAILNIDFEEVNIWAYLVSSFFREIVQHEDVEEMLTFKFEYLLVWTMDRKTIGLTVKIGQVRETDRAHGDNLNSITTSNGPPINILPNP